MNYPLCKCETCVRNWNEYWFKVYAILNAWTNEILRYNRFLDTNMMNQWQRSSRPNQYGRNAMITPAPRLFDIRAPVNPNNAGRFQVPSPAYIPPPSARPPRPSAYVDLTDDDSDADYKPDSSTAPHFQLVNAPTRAGNSANEVGEGSSRYNERKRTHEEEQCERIIRQRQQKRRRLEREMRRIIEFGAPTGPQDLFTVSSTTFDNSHVPAEQSNAASRAPSRAPATATSQDMPQPHEPYEPPQQ